MWCIPKVDNAFVMRMEDVLAQYEKPLCASEPVVCLDEKSVQCLADKRKTIRVRNGSVRRDYEYIRRGTVNVFCAVEPKAGRHFTKVTAHRKKQDFTAMLQDLAAAYPEATTIHLVMDNLNTHFATSLTDTLGEAEGEKLWSRFTPHYTPKHASWLNQAEIEIGLFSRQCLAGRRIDSADELTRQASAWNQDINHKQQTINWSFSRTDARLKFRYCIDESKSP